MVSAGRASDALAAMAYTGVSADAISLSLPARVLADLFGVEYTASDDGEARSYSLPVADAVQTCDRTTEKTGGLNRGNKPAGKPLGNTVAR